MTQTVLTYERDGVRHLVVNRPDAMNALDSRLVNALTEAATAAAADPTVRVIVLTGAGERAFIAGADVSELQSFDSTAAQDYCRRLVALGEILSQAPKPVIAAINGWCLGGGLELALACDVRLAADTARFGLPEVKLAILPGGGGVARLSRLVGGGVARDLILSGEIIDAERAFVIGLVSRLTPADQLAEATTALARQLTGFSPTALAAIKRHMNATADQPLDTALLADADACARLFGSADRKAAMNAFLDKRQADFSQSPAPDNGE